MTAQRPQPAQVADLARRLARAMLSTGATARDVATAAGGAIDDDGPPLGLRARARVAGVEGVSVTRVWDSEAPNAAEIRLAAGLSLAELQRLLGPATPMPSRRPGDGRVRFDDAEPGATIIAAIDDADAVRSIAVRRD